MNRWRPLTSPLPPSRTIRVLSCVGSDDAVSGSLIAKHDPISPLSSGSRQRRACAGAAAICSNAIVPLSGALQLKISTAQGTRPMNQRCHSARDGSTRSAMNCRSTACNASERGESAKSMTGMMLKASIKSMSHPRRPHSRWASPAPGIGQGLRQVKATARQGRCGMMSALTALDTPP